MLYGQPGSGKTCLSLKLANHLKTKHIIDGDIFRNIFENVNYSRQGREENISRANTVATYLHKTNNGHIILALVNPYQSLRDDLRLHNPYEVTEILLTTNRDLRKDYHVSDFEIGRPNVCLNTDRPIEKTWESLLSQLDKQGLYP